MKLVEPFSDNFAVSESGVYTNSCVPCGVAITVPTWTCSSGSLDCAAFVILTLSSLILGFIVGIFILSPA